MQEPEAWYAMEMVAERKSGAYDTSVSGVVQASGACPVSEAESDGDLESVSGTLSVSGCGDALHHDAASAPFLGGADVFSGVVLLRFRWSCCRCRSRCASRALHHDHGRAQASGCGCDDGQGSGTETET